MFGRREAGISDSEKGDGVRDRDRNRQTHRDRQTDRQTERGKKKMILVSEATELNLVTNQIFQ